MIEIVARFLGERAVFIAGETIEVEVTIRVSKKKDGKSGAKLAWLSAQVHCQCSVFEREGGKVPDKDALSHETAFVPFKGEKGMTVQSSKPTILSCNLPLDSELQHTHTFKYLETLPSTLPPSFRGSCLKYSHKVSIGGQVVGRKIRIIRLPFRVLVVPGLLEGMRVMEENGDDDIRPTNPFFQPPPNDNTFLDVAMENIQSLTCRKNSGLYNITNRGGRVVELVLHKQAFRLGDDVVGECSFANADVACVQFSVTLQCVEQLLEHSKLSNHQGLSPAKVSNFTKHEEFCIDLERTSIHLPIPLTITPAFHTPLVSVKWRLHFEFVTMTSPISKRTIGEGGSIFRAPKSVGVEVMVWDLPVKIYSTNPYFVNKLSLISSSQVNGHL